MHIAQIDVAVRSNQPRRGRVILMAGLTAREIFPPCHYFATTKLWENESCHVGRNQMAGLNGKSGPPGKMVWFAYPTRRLNSGFCLSVHSLHRSSPCCSACSLVSNNSPSIL